MGETKLLVQDVGLEDAAAEAFDALAHIEAASAKLGLCETFTPIKEKQLVRRMIDRLDALAIDCRALWQRLERGS